MVLLKILITAIFYSPITGPQILLAVGQRTIDNKKLFDDQSFRTAVVGWNEQKDEHPALRIGGSEEFSGSTEIEDSKKKRSQRNQDFYANIPMYDSVITNETTKEENYIIRPLWKPSVPIGMVSSIEDYDSKELESSSYYSSRQKPVTSRKKKYKQDNNENDARFGINTGITEADLDTTKEQESIITRLRLTGADAELLRQTLRKRWKSCGIKTCTWSCRNAASNFCSYNTCSLSMTRKLGKECQKKCKAQFQPQGHQSM